MERELLFDLSFLDSRLIYINRKIDRAGVRMEDPQEYIKCFLDAADSAWGFYKRLVSLANEGGDGGEGINDIDPGEILIALIRNYGDLHRGLPLVLTAMAHGQYSREILQEYLNKFGRELGTVTDEVKLTIIHAEYIVMYEKHATMKERRKRLNKLVNVLLEERRNGRKINEEYAAEVERIRQEEVARLKKQLLAAARNCKQNSCGS